MMDLCWLVHRYGKWKEMYQTNVVILGDFGRASDSPRVCQDRKCLVCGKVQSRLVRKGTLRRADER